MKRIITIALSIAVCMSLLTYVPAQAEELSAEFPYISENFDGGNKTITSGKAMLLSPGVGEEGFALRSLDASGAVSFTLGNGKMDTGRRYGASCFLRIREGSADAVTFSLVGLDTNGEEKRLSMASTDIVSEEWKQISASAVWSGRFSDDSKWDGVSPLSLEIALGKGVIFDIDDVIFEPKQETAGAEGVNILTNSGFENGKTGWNGGAVVSDGTAPEGNSYLSLSASTNSWMQATRNLTFCANHLYKISYWVKGDSAFNNSGAATDTFGIYMLQSARTRIIDTNSFNTDLPGYVQNGFPVNGEWQKVEYYYQFEYKTFTNKEFQMIFRVFPKGMQSTTATGSFGLDDFQIVDMGQISNGSFENSDTTIMKFINPTGETNKSKVEKTEQNVLAWNEKNATAEISSDVRPDTTGKHSMKVSITKDGGYVYQGVGLDKADTDYKISFWAKGVGLSEETPFALVLDRAVPKPGGELESYDVPDKVYYTGKNENNVDGSFGTWNLSGEWKYYECVVKNRFPLKAGLDAANADTIPRLPFMYFDVDGNGAETSYIVDDIEISEYDANTDSGIEGYPYPYLTDVAFAGNFFETGTVQVHYTFNSLCGAENGGSHVRLFVKEGEGERLVLTTTENSFVIPKGLGGMEIRVEAVPVDNTGRMGTPQSKVFAVENALTLSADIDTWETDGTVTATVTATNREQIDDIPVLLILAAYDENNQMLAMKTEHAVLSSDGMSADISFSAPETATAVKLYVWSGGDLTESGKNVYTDVIARTK